MKRTNETAQARRLLAEREIEAVFGGETYFPVPIAAPPTLPTVPNRAPLPSFRPVTGE